MDDFGRLSKDLGYLLHRTDVLLMGRMAAALEELGLTPARASAVVYIALHQGCDQVALGRALAINRASTMKVVNSLVALGYVERRPGRDRRSNALHVTAAGADARLRIEEITGSTDAANFAGLSDRQRNSLRALLEELLRFQPVEPVARAGQGMRLRAI